MQKERLVIAADCTILVNQSFSERFKRGETVVIGCPLLEDPDRLLEKINLIAKESSANEMEVYTMEVPCCHAIHMMVARALEESKRADVKASYFIVRVMNGKVEPYQPGVIDSSMIEAERKAHGHML